MHTRYALMAMLSCLALGLSSCDGGSSSGGSGEDTPAPGADTLAGTDTSVPQDSLDDSSIPDPGEDTTPLDVEPSDTEPIEEACAWDTQVGEDTQIGEDTVPPGEDTIEDVIASDTVEWDLMDGMGWDGSDWDGIDWGDIDWDDIDWDGIDWDEYSWDTTDWGDIKYDVDWDWGAIPDTGAEVCPGGITDIGCCEGAINKYCGGGSLIGDNCADYGESCGWIDFDGFGYYGCGGEGADPSGLNPIQCP